MSTIIFIFSSFEEVLYLRRLLPYNDIISNGWFHAVRFADEDEDVDMIAPKKKGGGGCG